MRGFRLTPERRGPQYLEEMLLGLVTVLSQVLFPLLPLGSLRALSRTCTALRAAVRATSPQAWLQAARYVSIGSAPAEDQRRSRYLGSTGDAALLAGTACRWAIPCVWLLMLPPFQSVQTVLPGSTAVCSLARL